MKDWNIIVTTPPGQERELLPALNHLGKFTRSDFHGLLVGRAEEVPRFLEDIRHVADEHHRSSVLILAHLNPYFLSPRTPRSRPFYSVTKMRFSTS